jgi:hypothetical protein
MRTARARTSAENLFAFVIAQSSQRNEPLQNPRRFSIDEFTHLAQLVSCTLEFVLHRQFEKLRDALKVGIAR